MKKAQITIFIMIGIVLVIAIAFVLLLSQTKIERPSAIEANIQSIQSYMQDCVQKAGKDVLVAFGTTGGSMDGTVAAYVFQGRNIIPGKQELEDRFARAVKQEAAKCIGEILSYEPVLGTGTAQASFEDAVTLKLTMPVRVKLPDGTKDLSPDYAVQYPARMGVYYALADAVSREPVGMVPYSTLLEYDVETNAIVLEDGVLYVVKDKKSIIDQQPFVFQFATTWVKGTNPLA